MKQLIQSALRRLGLDVRRIPKSVVANPPPLTAISRIHYGCGGTVYGKPWMNADVRPIRTDAPFVCTDLTRAHPFPSDYFAFGFSEEFLEHLDQEESLLFLIESYRTLRPGGVLRIVCPSMESVLKTFYSPPVLEVAAPGGREAYEGYGHKHYYSRPTLELVARHIGFSKVTFCELRESDHQELRELEVRNAPEHIHAELTK